MGPRTLYEVLVEAAATYGGRPALHQPAPKEGQGKYRTYTWVEYRQAVEEIACGLRAAGIRRGDIVALASDTRAEFYFADLGVMSCGATAAALYTSYPKSDLVRTLRACQARAVFVEDAALARSMWDAGAADLDLTWILLEGETEGALSLEELRRQGREAMASEPGLTSRLREEVCGQDAAILYLTSGATGEPKMALVSHAALVANINLGPKVLDFGPEDCTLVFLPSAHIAQRVVLELLPIRMGLTVWFSEGLARLPLEFRSVRPTFILAPPRVWERVYSSVCAEIRKRPAPIQKLFYGALGLGQEAYRLRLAGKPQPAWMRAALSLADRLLFRKIRERLGGRLRIPASGAAPLGKELAEFYAAIGMPLVEGYGLTEGGVTMLNPVDAPRPGSIGKPLPGVPVRCAEDGELLIGGPTLFTGYFRDPETTAAVLRDGWLYTGDLAEIDSEGFITITGRKKELIVSSNGRKIYPARIESLLKSQPVVSQVVLLGDRQPFLTALFTYHGESKEAAEAEIRRLVARVNRQLAHFEQIRKFKVLDHDFTIERGELTPTLKVRRARVLENYRPLIREMYAGKEEFL